MMDELEEDDFLIVEALDLSDEKKLRHVVSTVESLALPPGGRGLRVSVLTAEQWKTALRQMLPPGLRRGSAHMYLHTLRDPRDQRHLLVSPSAVEGINEDEQMMYQDVVYAALRCLPTELPILLRRGIDDLIAAAVAERIEVKLFTRTHLRESDFAIQLLRVLSEQFGYSELDWALEMRRQPKRCLTALRKTGFAAFWLQRTGADSTSELVEILTQERMSFEDPQVAAVEESLVAFAEEGKSS